MTTSEANARQQGRSQKARNGSQFLATRLTAATSLQTPDNNLRTGSGAQCAHPSAAPVTSDPSTPRADMRHPHRHAARPRGHAPSKPAATRARTVRTGARDAQPSSNDTNRPHSPLPQARAPRSPRLTLPTPRSRRQLTPRLVRTRRIREGGPDPHRVWPACRKQCLEHADHADASLLSTTRPSSSKVPMASRRRISSGQCAMKSRASTV